MQNRTVIVFILCFLLVLNYSFSQEKNDLNYSQINKIKINDDIGIIKETYVPNKNSIPQLAVCIQDAHCNYEAQMNIGLIVKYLVEEHQFTLVCAEGSTGVIDTSPFAAFKDRKVKQEFADYFIKQGKITGPEYLSITSDLDFTIFGIEDESLYAENYTAFMKTIEVRDKVNSITTRVLDRLRRLKLAIYNQNLKEVDNKAFEYENQLIEFDEYVSFLEEKAAENNIDLSSFKSFAIQTVTKKIESTLDFKKVEIHRENLINKFNETYKDDKKKLKSIVHKSLSYKLNEIDAQDYYKFLIDRAVEAGIDIKSEDYSEIIKYHSYLSNYNQIDKVQIIDEVWQVSRHLRDNFYINETEKELDYLFRITTILDKLFKLETIKNDYKFFKENEADFNILNAKSFIVKHGPKHDIYLGFNVNNGIIQKNLPFVINFYEAALKRDQVLISNSIKRMKEQKTNRFIIVTGGFHSDGLSNLLKEEKHPYILIAPRILDGDVNNDLYIQIMKGQADSVKGYRP